MASLNETKLIGNLTADAELKYVGNGKALCSFRLAVNERYKDAQGNWKDGDPLFMDCELWGDAAERVSKALTKGKNIAAFGKLKLDQWEDKETKGKRSKVVLMAFQVFPIEKVESENGDEKRSDDRGRREEPAREERGGGNRFSDRLSGAPSTSAPASRPSSGF